MNYVFGALLGALAAVMAQRGIAVFNDGLRPIMPEYIEGRMDKKALAATSFALCFGLVIGFGIPVSLAATVILVHSILLGTDIIGTWSPAGKKGLVISAIIGAIYGVGIVAGLQAVVQLFALLPVNFLPSMALVGTPIVVSFAAFPALVVAYQYGTKKGVLTFVISFLIRQWFVYYGKFIIFGIKLSIDPEGMALLAGMMVMLFFALREKPEPDAMNIDLAAIFSARVARIRKNAPILAVAGGIAAAATSCLTIAGDPISLNLAAHGKTTEAALTAFARGIGFIPLLATTAITTGVYSPVGMTFIFVAGFLLRNPYIAFVVGCIIMLLEIALLNSAASMLDRFPGVRKCGDNIRTSMTKVLEVALLVGGMMAAHSMAPGLGLFVVVGIYVLNQTTKKPLVGMAVGPVGAIFTGILINVLYWLGLYLPPVVK